MALPRTKAPQAASPRSRRVESAVFRREDDIPDAATTPGGQAYRRQVGPAPAPPRRSPSGEFGSEAQTKIVAVADLFDEFFADDAATAEWRVDAKHGVVEVAPPALPIPLTRRKDAWIEELPSAARAVLAAAESMQPAWPEAGRCAGAVLLPRKRVTTSE